MLSSSSARPESSGTRSFPPEALPIMLLSSLVKAGVPPYNSSFALSLFSVTEKPFPSPFFIIFHYRGWKNSIVTFLGSLVEEYMWQQCWQWRGSGKGLQPTLLLPALNTDVMPAAWTATLWPWRRSQGNFRETATPCPPWAPRQTCSHLPPHS